MKVIKYEPRYFDEIVQLYVQVFSQAPWSETFDVTRVAAMLRKHVANNYFMGYLGIENEHVIAVSYGFIKPWYEGFEYYIEEFFIAPNYQQQGLGQQLINEIQSALVKQDIHSMMLMTRPHSGAQKFYEKTGFQQLTDLAVFTAAF